MQTISLASQIPKTYIQNESKIDFNTAGLFKDELKIFVVAQFFILLINKITKFKNVINCTKRCSHFN